MGAVIEYRPDVSCACWVGGRRSVGRWIAGVTELKTKKIEEEDYR